MVDDTIICQKCGGEMVPTVEGSVQGLKCSQCGEWDYVTTYLPEIYSDKTIYSVFLQPNNPATMQMIKNIAAVANCNFIKAKELLCTTGQKILEGTAQTILEAVGKLKSAGIRYVISPDFKYDNSMSE